MSASTRFALGTFAASDSRPFAGLVVGDRVWELGPHLGAAVTLRSLVERWDRSFPELQALADRIDGENGTSASTCSTSSPARTAAATRPTA
jgi:hypothetical protein